MLDNFINWKYLDLWIVPVNAFNNTKEFNKELDSASRIVDNKQTHQIEQKALDSIKLTVKPKRGKAKLFPVNWNGALRLTRKWLLDD